MKIVNDDRFKDAHNVAPELLEHPEHVESLKEKEALFQDGQWMKYLYRYSGHDCIKGVWRIYSEHKADIEPKVMDELIMEAYKCTDKPSLNMKVWNILLGSIGQRFYSDSGKPAPVTDSTVLFRGYRAKPRSRALGYSWTLDRDVALRFLRPYKFQDGFNHYLATTTVDPQKIKGYLTLRDEAEIILMPEDARPNMKRTKVTP